MPIFTGTGFDMVALEDKDHFSRLILVALAGGISSAGGVHDGVGGNGVGLARISVTL